MRLIVDVMSGDSEALEAVKGSLKAHRELGVDITLVGDEKTVIDALDSLSVAPDDSIKVVHASSVVTMSQRPDSSSDQSLRLSPTTNKRTVYAQRK